MQYLVVIFYLEPSNQVFALATYTSFILLSVNATTRIGINDCIPWVGIRAHTKLSDSSKAL